MHYYKHHIGDFDSKTRHLTRIERSIYRDLIELYYSTESPLSLEIAQLARKIAARTEEEKSALLAILDEYFDPQDDGYHHSRCDEELAAYHAKAETNRVIAVARESKKRERKEQNRAPDEHDSCTTGQPNHKPLTTNQEPRTKRTHKAAPDDATLFDGVSAQVVSDFKELRKAKRAKITPTAINGIRLEAEKADLSLEDALKVCCSRGWAGFEAAWLSPRDTRSAGNNMRVNHLDHASSKRAMEQSMKQHGITEIPQGEIEF